VFPFSSPLALAKTAWPGRADVNALANDCFTPLHFCVQKGSLEGCALLLRRKANTNAAVSKSGRTSLHMAAAKGNAQVSALRYTFASDE
jgi:ankyrin repeat protein